MTPMELAEHVDEIVLFSGDGDFRPLVEALQRRGVRVTVVSTISCQPPLVADDLRRQADVFTDLTELKSKIGRDPSERPPPRELRQHMPVFLQRDTTCDHGDFQRVAIRSSAEPVNHLGFVRLIAAGNKTFSTCKVWSVTRSSRHYDRG